MDGSTAFRNRLSTGEVRFLHFRKHRPGAAKENDIGNRKPVKAEIPGQVDPDLRNAQFENIENLRAHDEANGWPVLSVDTKKKEFLGGLYRDGKLYSQDGVPLERYDHDFPHLAEGRVVPHGIFDLNLCLALAGGLVLRRQR